MNEEEAAALAKSMGRECIAVRARLLSRVVTSLYDREVRPLGLKANQTTMLVCLAQTEGIDQAAIGRRLKMEKSTVSRGIERMKARGWVEHVDDDPHLLRLTASGRELLAQVHTGWLRAQEKAAEMIGPEAVEQLKAITAPMFRR